MDEARKNAYRRLLYSAMLDFRSHSVYPRDEYFWLKPWLWVRTRRRLLEIQEIANWLHNLALFSANDFAHFDEAWFWREMDVLFKRLPHLREHVALYRHEFETEWDKTMERWIKVREFGSCTTDFADSTQGERSSSS